MYYLVTKLRERMPENEIGYHYIEEEGKKYVIIDIDDEKGELITKLKIKAISALEVSKLKEIEEKIMNYIEGIKEIERRFK